MWPGIRAHLRAAAPIGLLAGMVVGVSEAAAAAHSNHGLAGASLGLAWAATLGIYATAGLAKFVVLGLILGAVPALRRLAPARVAGLYWVLAAMWACGAIMLSRADLGLPGLALAFLFARVAAVSLVAGAAVLGIFILWSWRRGPRLPKEGGRPWRWLVLVVPPALVVVLALTVPRMAYPAAEKAAPNVLLITVDALRADHLGAYGSKAGVTPGLDRLARDSVVFDKAFAAAPWTTASLGSLWSSVYPSELGLFARDRSQPETRFAGGMLTRHATLAELLRADGYTTIADVPNPQIRRDRGFARGFLNFRNPYDFGGETAPVLPRLGPYEAWFLHTSVGLRAAQALHRKPHYFRARGIKLDDGERVYRDSTAWLDKPGRRPFLMWLHVMDAHVPYNHLHPSPATVAAFPEPPVGLTEQFFKDLIWQRSSLNDRQKRFIEALYDDGVRYADHWIGRLLDDLRRKGLYDQMLIIVSADHGEEFWDHGGYEHGHSLYDEVLRVPLIIKFPQNQHAGERVSAQADLLDLLPTVMEVVRQRIPPGVRGESLVRAVPSALPRSGRRAPEAADRRTLFAEFTLYGEELKALRTARYKVIFHANSHAFEVYDLRADPGERHNLAGDQTVAAPLRQELVRMARDSAQREARWARRGHGAAGLDERTRERLRSLGYTGQ